MGDAADDALEQWEEGFTIYPSKRRKKKMNSMSDYYVNCEVEFKAITPMAVLVCQHAEEIWVPRSLLSYSNDREIELLNRGDEFTLKVREWFATQNSLEWSN